MTSPIDQTTLFGRSKLFLYGAALVLLVLALLVRLIGLSSPPTDIQAEQQAQFLLSVTADLPQRSAALPSIRNASATGDVPVLQAVDAALIKLLKQDAVATTRLVSIIGWIAAGMFLFYLLLQLAGADAALVGLGLFVFLPFGFQFSRAVLPAAWVTALSVAAIYVLIRWSHRQTWLGAIGFGVLAAFAAMMDPAGLYIPLAALLGVVYAMRRQSDRNLFVQVLVMGGLPLIARLLGVLLQHPAQKLVFAFLGINGSVSGLFSLKKFSRFELRVESIIGVLGIAFSLLGLLLAKKGIYRNLVVSLWIGFVVYGVFQLNVINGSFYPLYPLVFIAALSLAPVIELLAGQIRALPAAGAMTVFLILVLLAGIGLGSLDGRKLVKASEMAVSPKAWSVIGGNLGSNAVFMSNSSEFTTYLEYYGKSTPLCLPGDATCTKPLAKLADKYSTLELYFVSTQKLINQDAALKAELERLPFRCESESGLIFYPLTSNHPACSTPAK